jgi:hypothetical protein
MELGHLRLQPRCEYRSIGRGTSGPKTCAWNHAPRFLAQLLGFIAAAATLSGSLAAPDHDFMSRDNNNATLLVLVAGLAEKSTWTQLRKLIDSDAELSGIDYLVFHSPQELDLDGNVNRLAAILWNLPRSADYRRNVYIGHSIGGMIVKQLTLRLVQQPDRKHMPSMVVTFGTPFNADRFEMDLFRKAGATLFWFTRTPLEKQVFKYDRLKEINEAWRVAVKSPPLREVRQINVFGVQDSITPTQYESQSEISVFIRGDHMTILPNSVDDCSYTIFKALLRDQKAPLAELPCVSRGRM